MIIDVNFSNNELINTIQDLFCEVYKHKNELKNEIINNPYTKIYLYIENNNVLGLIHINNIYDRYEINNIFVLDKYRKKGIASKLIEKVISEGLKDKVINITLEVKESNYKAINLYKKYGFVAKAIRKGYYNGINGILMEKEMM